MKRVDQYVAVVLLVWASVFTFMAVKNHDYSIPALLMWLANIIHWGGSLMEKSLKQEKK